MFRYTLLKEMSIFRLCIALNLLHISLTATKNHDSCDNISVEATSMQTTRCLENTIRFGFATVLSNRICKGYFTFRNGKIPNEIDFEAEYSFFDTQQTLATNILFEVEPEARNVSLRYILNFAHNRYAFFLYIDGTLSSIYENSTVQRCISNASQTRNLGDYVKGRGIETLKRKVNELRDKWKRICQLLGVRDNPTSIINITNCIPYVGTNASTYVTMSTYVNISTHLTSWTYMDENASVESMCTCGLLPVVGIIAIVSITIVTVTVLVIIRKRLGSIENRYHKELSRYWL